MRESAMTACDRAQELGREMATLIQRLYPLCRSITGDGVRRSLKILQEQIPLTIHEVPSGTQVFDWTVPKEWNINEAFIKDRTGKKIVDFDRSNLHVVGYSVPFKGALNLHELKPHLFTLPEHPDWIPYRTSYYKETWGFCLSHREFLQLSDQEYQVVIDSSLQDGHLTYGEYFIEGETPDEVLISCHTCHPSLCNDNLSGIALATSLAKRLTDQPQHYSYRFLFIPGTIGSITWLCLNESRIPRIKHGLVLACLGDPGKMTYKRTRQNTAEIDRVAAYVLQASGDDHDLVDFSPYGYDERQFCSPAFNLPVGCLMRTPHGEFPEYHTSADNLSLVQDRHLVDSFLKCLSIIRVLEQNKTYMNLNPKCEPQLGKRGLYRSVGGTSDSRQSEMAMLWVLNLSDGNHDLLTISEKSRLSFDLLRNTAEILVQHGLLQETVKAN
jgi:aminopeptidase-like protein